MTGRVMAHFQDKIDKLIQEFGEFHFGPGYEAEIKEKLRDPLEALNDWDELVRKLSAKILIKMRDFGIADYLIGLLKDPEEEPEVRAAAADILAELKDHRIIDALIVLLNDRKENPFLQDKAAAVLVKINDPGIAESLNTALKDKNGQAIAIESIKLLQQQKDVKQLIRKLKDHQGIIRVMAAIALGELKACYEVSLLTAALKDEDKYVRSVSIIVLSKIGIPAVELLIAALKDKNKYVCAGAAEALGEIKDIRAIEPLIEVLYNMDWPFSLDRDCYVNPHMDEDEFIILYAATDALEKIGYLVVESLIANLKNASENRKSILEWALIRALGEIKDIRAIEPLIEFLENDRDEYEYIQLEAESALSKIGVPAVVPLIAALKNKNADIKAIVARILGKIRDLRAVEPLIGALNDKNENVRLEVARALGNLKDGAAVKPLVAALKDKSPRISVAVATALGRIGIPAIEPLVSALKDDSLNIREEASIALSKIGALAFEPLISLLNNENEDIRVQALVALGKIKDARVISVLNIALRDKSERLRRAARLLLKDIERLKKQEEDL